MCSLFLNISLPMKRHFADIAIYNNQLNVLSIL